MNVINRKFVIFSFVLFSLFTLQAQNTVSEPGKQQRINDTYEQRVKQYQNFHIENGPDRGRSGIFSQISRSLQGFEVQDSCVQDAMEVVYDNRDCNDFTANGLIRLLYMKKEKRMLSKQTEMDVQNCLLGFKYWWDDGRKDTTYRCYHTENHQALYHTAELLAGQLFKDKVFANGMTGTEHMKHARERLDRWLDFRFRFGFSEWLSASYYDVEIMLLTNLYDYAEDPLVRSRAGVVLDMLMFDLALNNIQGVLGSTTGRVYARSLLYGKQEISSVFKLAFGVGQFQKDNVMGATCLAASSYLCPKVIQEIAADYSAPMLNKQRVSIEVSDAPKYGLSFDNELDCHLFWSMQEFIHPLCIRMSRQISEKYDTWPYKDYDRYIRKYDEQIEQYGKIVNPRLDRFALSEANVVTYRTPDYMLSSVQDYRAGAPGYQQHIWQATLDCNALVFTNYPGSLNLNVTPNYWAGNAIMPRAAQFENVAVCIYNVPEEATIDFTHAYFPKDAFDEVTEKGQWIFGRKKDGYVALFSQNKFYWNKDEKGQVNDVVAPGRQNVWICEMGSKKQWGSFTKFMEAIAASTIKSGDLRIDYQSPTQGRMEFGWLSLFKVKGKEIALRNKYRYENPFCKSAFNSRIVEIKKGSDQLILDFDGGKRTELH